MAQAKRSGTCLSDAFVLPFSYLTPAAAALLGAFIWREYLSVQAIIGGVIIITSGIVIYWFREKPAFIPLEE